MIYIERFGESQAFFCVQKEVCIASKKVLCVSLAPMGAASCDSGVQRHRYSGAGTMMVKKAFVSASKKRIER